MTNPKYFKLTHYQKMDYRLTEEAVKDVLSVLAKLGYLNLPKHPLENNILQNPYCF